MKLRASKGQPRTFEFREQTSHRFPGRAEELRNLFVLQRDRDADSIFDRFPGRGPLQEKPGEFLRGGMGDPEGVDRLIGRMILGAEQLCRAQGDFAIVYEKLEKIRAPDKSGLRGLDQFRRRQARPSRYHCAQAKNLARLGDAEDDGPAVTRRCGKLGAALAKNEDAARLLSRDKQHRSLRIRDRGFDFFQLLDGIRGEMAEEIEVPQLAAQATVYDIEAVGRRHNTFEQNYTTAGPLAPLPSC